MATAATVTIRLDGDSATLVRELNKANEAARSTFGDIQRSAADVAAKLAVIGAAAGVAFAALTRASFESIDALAKTADRLGVTTEAMRTLQVAADLAGVGQEQLTKSLQKQQQALFNASQGSASAVEAFRQLGLNVEQLMGLQADQQFEVIAGAIANVDNVTRRNALAMEIWGARAAEMINFAAEAGGGVGDLRNTLDALNVTVSRFDASKIEQANDAVSVAKLAFEGLGNTLAVAVAPYVTALAEQFTEAAASTNGFQNEVDTAMQFVAKAVGFAGNAVRGLEIGFKLVAEAVLGVSGDVANFVGFLTGNGAIKEFGKNAKGAAADIHQSVLGALNKPLPSDAIDKWFADARAKADAAASEIASKIQHSAGGQTDTVGASDAAWSKQVEMMQHMADLEKAIGPTIEIPEIVAPKNPLMDPEWVRQSTMMSAQAYLEQWTLANQQRMEMENEFRDTLFLNEQEAGAALIQLAAQHARERVTAEFVARGEAMGENGDFIDPNARSEFEIQVQEQTLALEQEYLNRRLGMQQQFGAQYLNIHRLISSTFGKQWTDTHSKTLQNTATFAGAAMSITQTLFGQNKKVAIATAVIGTLAGAARALQDLPFPANIAAAATVLANGMAKVSAIKGTNIGGGGVGGMGGGISTGGLSSEPTQQPISNPLNDAAENRRTAVQVVFNGDVVGWDDFMRDRFVGSLRDIVDGNDVILFSGNSRQAAEIRGGA